MTKQDPAFWESVLGSDHVQQPGQGSRDLTDYKWQVSAWEWGHFLTYPRSSQQHPFSSEPLIVTGCSQSCSSCWGCHLSTTWCHSLDPSEGDPVNTGAWGLPGGGGGFSVLKKGKYFCIMFKKIFHLEAPVAIITTKRIVFIGVSSKLSLSYWNKTEKDRNRTKKKEQQNKSSKEQ